ncbi:Hypothetical predicted protein [Mytilus galloprovincialis]|uniref:Endonuclease/exonuclease/phosphatase domain-containing protein n=1 Tax=Mytilus galloprovincialis TaxID=29158 RepID=A0A8B6GX59_MYTGA|nr:Hypothetical predicted protein [Mytilus galloprovincialis]
MKNRKKVSKNRSGGITLGYKLELANKIKFLPTDSQFVLWFKVSSDLLDIDDDIVFGIVYIPPEYTNYSSQDAYSQLENEYIIFSNNYKYVSLLGDFNGRTADDDDFVIIHNDKHIDNLTDFIENKVYMLEELNIPKKRKSLDRVKNGYGKRLLDLCKGNNLFIVNGRIGDDRQYEQQDLRQDFIQMVKSDLNITLHDRDIVAIHRLPAQREPRPLIVRCFNTDIKRSIMRKRKELRNKVKFVDDVTTRNIALIKRLEDSGRFDQVWYFNCGIYGRTDHGLQMKYGLYDDINRRLREGK